MTDAVADQALTPPFATKIAVVLSEGLQAWQELNVTAFLAAGIAAANPQLIGQAYADADEANYLPLLGMPVLVFQAGTDTLQAARQRALHREVPLAVYTREMFATGFDSANRAVVAEVGGDDLDLVGIALHGPKNAVDKIVKGSRLHP